VSHSYYLNSRCPKQGIMDGPLFHHSHKDKWGLYLTNKPAVQYPTEDITNQLFLTVATYGASVGQQQSAVTAASGPETEGECPMHPKMLSTTFPKDYWECLVYP
jgi:hypothetical protein